MWFSTVRRSCVHRLAVCVCVYGQHVPTFTWWCMSVCACMCLCGMSVFICRSAKCMMIFQLVIFIFAFRQRLWQYIIATTESQQQSNNKASTTTATTGDNNDSNFSFCYYWLHEKSFSFPWLLLWQPQLCLPQKFLRLLSCFPAFSVRCCCLSLFCTKIEKATIKNLFFRWTNIAAATVAAATSCHKVFN